MIVDERALVAAVRELAAESPGFVYLPPEGPGMHCKYVHETVDGALVGGCIVGQAALKVGVPVLQLVEFDESEASGVRAAFSEFSISPEVLNWLGRVQDAQDNGRPWSKAVERADRGGDLYA